VGSYPANALGLYDMHGNLWEWCNDWYGAYGEIVTDPVGAGADGVRVIRGGSWISVARYCRAALRRGFDPSSVSYNLGFRVVRSSAP
jgi:sulfatase modifying factor 1